jgi:hypothetical protein
MLSSAIYKVFNMIGEKSHDIPLRPKKHPTTSYYILV